MNYYEHHLGDYLRDTAHLSAIEDGIYRRLIDCYYIHEKPLIDFENICRLIRIFSKKEKVLTKKILDEFFIFENNAYRNLRCDYEIARYKAKSTSARNSANTRWQAKHSGKQENANASQEKCKRNANAYETHMPTQCEGNAPSNQTPITNNHKPIKEHSKRGTRLPDNWIAPQDFIDFCRTERPDLDANLIALQFHDYWIAAPGSKALKNNWLATWRNWVRRQEVNKSRYKNKSEIISDSQFDEWLGVKGSGNARLE